ncbi:MAG: hypothetical protein KatS3mg096_611 [Candidatus Parcubacteria bacterium]|nr:MAG: hypothetical protein KatS3mg096_611 [Candidatus Parcubacteria bacterium]
MAIYPNIPIYYYDNHNYYSIFDKYFFDEQLESGTLVSDFTLITNLKKLINDISEFNISYEEIRYILKKWYEENANANNTTNIEQNKEILCRYKIVDRTEIINYFGELMAYEILQEFEYNSRQCRMKAYSFGESIIRSWVSDIDMINIFNAISQYKLDFYYKEYGIHGKNYNDLVAGIMDFIEGTNEFTGSGIVDMNLTFKLEGKDKPQLIAKLKQYLWEFNFRS